MSLRMPDIRQLVCIFCGRNRPVKPDFRLKEMDIDPADFGLISIRSVGAGPGRGHVGESGAGLKRIGRLNMLEALRDPEHSELAEQVRQRLIIIVKSYMNVGLIDLSELE